MNSALSTARKVVRRETKSSLHAHTRSQYNLFERLQDEGQLEEFLAVRSAERSPHRVTYGTMDRRNSAPSAAEQAAAASASVSNPGGDYLIRASSSENNSARGGNRLPPTGKQYKTNVRDLIPAGNGNGSGNGNGVAGAHSSHNNNYSNDFIPELSPVSPLTGTSSDPSSSSSSGAKATPIGVSLSTPPFLSSKKSVSGALTPETGWWFSPAIDFAFFWETLRTNRVLSAMLLFIPLGIVSGFLEWSPTYTFVFNFIGIIPLAWLLGEATEELALRTNQTIGGLLNATFGNAVELIVSVVALQKGMISLVQTSLLGSILSNLLLVLGTSFLLGGLYYPVQNYNRRGAHIFSSLLLLSCIAIAIPASFMNAFSPALDSLLLLSRITASIIFLIYLLYLYFQLFSHAHVFDDEKVSRNQFSNLNVAALNNIAATDTDSKTNGEERAILADAADEDDEDVHDSDEQANMSGLFALLLLAKVTILVSICSDYLVDSIQYITTVYNIPQAFVGVILLPIVANAAEHWTAVTVAMKNKMDLSIGVAIGSSTQIALFLIPFCTLLAWVIGQPMTLNFNVFDTVVMTFSVIIVNFVVKNGESNWLEGCLLIGAYFIIGAAYFFHPPG